MGGATATVADAQFLVANDPALIPLLLDARPGPHLPHVPTGPHPPDPWSF
jgi:hypothetical protein